MPENNITDRFWRLNNLYKVVNEKGAAVIFKMLPAQRYLYRTMSFRNITLKARQLGFTTFIDLLGLDIVLWSENIRAGILAHTKIDAQAIFQDKIMFPYENLPPDIKKMLPPVKSDAGELRLKNNSSMRVGVSFRSSTAQFLHIDEFGKICAQYPKKAREIVTGCLPAVHAGSFLFITGTAEGRAGSFHDMCEDARLKKTDGINQDLKFHFFPWWQHPNYRIVPYGIDMPDRYIKYFEMLAKRGITLGDDQRAWYRMTEGGTAGLGDDMKREHPSFPEEAFEQAIKGAYYRQQIDDAYSEGRITNVPHDPNYPVDTAWDIGRYDSTAIWFSQDIGGKVRLIDYYENSQEDLEHYVTVLKEREKQFKYSYGRMIAPFDIRVHLWGAGKTRIEQALSYGLAFEIAPDVGILDGIDVGRRMFRDCWFDKTRCDDGLKALTSYRKEWNDNYGDWSSMPLKNWACHGADSFRYLAISRSPGSTNKSYVSKVSNRALYNRKGQHD